MTTAAARRELVIFPGALGDFLCFLPTLRFLSQGKEIDLLARSEFADLAPPTVKIGSLERYEVRRLFVRGAALEERLRDFFTFLLVYLLVDGKRAEHVCPGTY